jgi:hypothetical protein
MSGMSGMMMNQPLCPRLHEVVRKGIGELGAEIAEESLP